MQDVSLSPGFAPLSESIAVSASLSERMTEPAENEFPEFSVVELNAAIVAAIAAPSSTRVSKLSAVFEATDFFLGELRARSAIFEPPVVHAV
jgi:hypothetical protein